MTVAAKLQALAARWASAKAAERANAQTYLRELAEALGVEVPRPAGTGYEFEFPVRAVTRDGVDTTNFIDLYKRGHFALEAKDEEASRSNDLLLRKAFGQVRNYVGQLPEERPPYVLVLDVAKTLIVWDCWAGDYGGFNAGQRIDLPLLHANPDAIALLQDIWANPTARDPRGRAAQVTQEIAGRLATLAASLEERGHDQEAVARFLIRCVFTMFAEDVDLLPDEPLRQIIDRVALSNPEEFAPAVEDLWRAMDEGRRFGFRKLLRFNGHFFRDAAALPLTREDLALLLEAAAADWQDVEPSIFGTLLVRALDPEERHRLGAEYTPREFVERLVRPTVEEPVRERWTTVQAEVLQLRETNKVKNRKAAVQRLREFHGWLRGLRFLDPACGSGNFLYVTLHTVKRIELEVIRLLEELAHDQQALRLDEVGPWQFHGIEVKPWAREITELTLWIGFHQFWRQYHDVQPPEPILQDTGTLECRDAVLAWDAVRLDPTRGRPDPTPRLPHQVTQALVPAPDAVLVYEEHVGAKPAPWPETDFIVGNPPYLGNKRMREVFGDGYVDALRAAYPEVPESADYVMYWWYRAAEAVASGRTIRAGLITTNSITQSNHQPILAAAASRGAVVAWAIPDHPWVDGAGDADVRVAMTVIANAPPGAVRIEVDSDGRITRELRVPRLNADLTAHADVAGAATNGLLANRGMSSRGFTLVGRGFVLTATEAARLLTDSRYGAVVRPYRNGKDLSARPRGVYVIDFGLLSQSEAQAYPLAYDVVRDRVKPGRDANNDKSTREKWWRFGRNREEIRPALQGLSRYIATPYVSKHRFFTFLPADVAPDEKLVVVATDAAYLLGILSSRIHETWALAAGSRLGVGNDPTYNNSRCFEAFPFPDPGPVLRRQIADVAERLDRHRCEALGRDRCVTMTGMYNVVRKLRSGEPLTAPEQAVHAQAACGVLRDLHDRIDGLVAQAYGWGWPESPAVVLERLVALHGTRALEEAGGTIRWLRPEYQKSRFGAETSGVTPVREANVAPAAPAPPASLAPWPKDAIGQITALRQLINAGPLSLEAAVARFGAGRRDIIARHLDTLALLGEIQLAPDGQFHELLSPV